MPLTREQQIELMRTAPERHAAWEERVRALLKNATARARAAAEGRGYETDPRITVARSIKTGG